MGLSMMGGGSLLTMRWASWKPAVRRGGGAGKRLHCHASAGCVNNAALAKAPLVMVVDHQRTAIIAENAASGAFRGKLAESDGTVINNEGRAQRFFRAWRSAYYDNKTIVLLALAAFTAQHRRKPRSGTDSASDHVIDAVIAAMPHFCFAH